MLEAGISGIFVGFGGISSSICMCQGVVVAVVEVFCYF